MLEPQGPAAMRVSNLWWLLFWLATAVFFFVISFLILALFRRPPHERTTVGTTVASEGKWNDSAVEVAVKRRGTRVVLWAGIIMPLIILVLVYGATLWTLRAMATPEIDDELTIHVIGQRWWWEVQYPQQQFATANELHIPAGEPVRIVLSSPNVVHSFWVPALQGKMDLVPGLVNSLWLEADEPGIYRGECAEFCGVQHAKMNFLVIAQPRADYDQWLIRQQQPARQPETELEREGQRVFFKAECMNCHTIRGTDATGKLGPDLTHLAGRRTIGSAVLENNLGNLGGWVTNSQHVKPGNLMPPTSNITGVELQALLAYLATLE